LHGLFPHDLTAQRLRQQSYTLAEFLGTKLQNYRPPRLARRAIVHGHCHQKAIMGMDAEVALLKAMELDVHFVDSGPCATDSVGSACGRVFRLEWLT
jgi:hypothetical protein